MPVAHVNTRVNLTSHTKILDRILNSVPSSKEDQDNIKTTYNLDPNFVVNISTKEDNNEVEPIHYNINCHIDGMAPSLMTTGMEQVCLSTKVIMTLLKKQFISATMPLRYKLKYLLDIRCKPLITE